MAHVVYTGVNGQSELKGSLFEGQKFWFSQKVPQRQWFVEQVEASTGQAQSKNPTSYTSLTCVSAKE